MVDIVGHIPVLIILVAPLLQGETHLQQAFRGSVSGSWATGGAVLFRYVATLTTLMSLYYGLRSASVWGGG